jgi:hypothetical protein
MESYQYFYRRISFFELKAYTEAGMDAEHNLQIMDIVRQYAVDDQDKYRFEQYRPFVILHRTRARGLQSVDNGDLGAAVGHIEEGIQEIEDFFNYYDRTDLIKESHELKVLREWLDQIRIDRPATEEERLRVALQEAVDSEEFEKAAEIRDKLKKYQS